MKGMLMVGWTIVIMMLAGCGLAGLGDHANGASPNNASNAGGSANGSRDALDGSNRHESAGTTVSARDQETVDSLKKGGYVILLPHVATKGPREQGGALHDESAQNQTKELGDAILKLSIPVGHVLSSPDPGAFEDSTRSFGYDQVETTEVLRLRDPSGVQRVDELGAELQQLLSSLPAPGKNTILVSTSPTPESPKEAEAETMILKPLGNGDFQRVAILAPEQWAELAGSTR